MSEFLDKRVIISKQYLKDIANAIRNKLGTYDQNYTPEEMPDAIRSIETNTFVTSFLHDKKILFSGTIGTCNWEISTKGVLFLYAGTLPEVALGVCEADSDFIYNKNATASPWSSYSNFIKLVSFEGPVIAGEDISCLFAGLDKLWLLNGMSYFDLSNTKKMSSLFNSCSGLAGVDFSMSNLSAVTDMSHLFYNCAGIMDIKFPNPLISEFHCPKKIEDLRAAFCGCVILDQLNLESFFSGDNIISLEQTFFNCKALKTIKQNFHKMYNLQSFQKTFENCWSLQELDCSNWYTSANLSSMRRMFFQCKELQILDLSNINISNVISFKEFLSGCTVLSKLITTYGWIFGANTNFEDMFANSSVFLDVSLWDVSACTSFFAFFENWQGNQELDFTLWDTSSVFTMKNMFKNCKNLTKINLVSFDVRRVIDMSSMFENCYSLDFENITFFNYNQTRDSLLNMQKMFQNCRNLTSFSFKFNTFNVKNVNNNDDKKTFSGYDGLLAGCSRLKLVDLTNWTIDPTLVNDPLIMGYNMFDKCYAIEEIRVGNSFSLNYFKEPEIDEKSGEFVYYSPLFPIYAYKATTQIDIPRDKIFAIDAPIPSFSAVYYGIGALSDGITFNSCIKQITNTNINKNNFYTIQDTIIKHIIFTTFSSIEEKNEIYDINSEWVGVGAYGDNKDGVYAKFDWEAETLYVKTNERFVLFPADSNYIFYRLGELQDISFIKANARLISSLSYAFSQCDNLDIIDLSFFSQSPIRNLVGCFSYCNNLQEIDFSILDSSSLKNLSLICAGCLALTTVTFFESTRNTSYLYGKEMFIGCKQLVNFIQSEYGSFSFMDKENQIGDGLSGAFSGCIKLTSINLTQWNVSSVRSFSHMFYNCTALQEININTWNLGVNVEDLSSMFENCVNLYQINFWQNSFSNVGYLQHLKNISYMFSGCEKIGCTKRVIGLEESFESGTFTMPAMTLTNTLNSNGTYSIVDASNVLAGCVGIKTLDLSYFSVYSTIAISLDNILENNNFNLNNWTHSSACNNFENIYEAGSSYSNNFSFTVANNNNAKVIYKKLTLTQNKDYTFSFIFKNLRNFLGDAYAYISTAAPETAIGNKVLGNYVKLASVESEGTGLEHFIDFTCSGSGSTIDVYFIFNFSSVSKNSLIEGVISKLSLYQYNSGVLPKFDNFITAESGPRGDPPYALEYIVTNNALAVNIYNNSIFTIRQPSVGIIKYHKVLEPDSEDYSNDLYYIKAGEAGRYKIIYDYSNSSEQENLGD